MRFVLAAPFVLLAACSQQSAPPSPIPPGPSSSASGGTQLVLRVGESAALGEDYRLSFQSVASDSRCPTDVQCVWEGEAALVVGPSHPLMRFRPDTLRLRGGRAVDSMQVGPFVVKPIALAPARLSTHPVPADSYRATFAVRRR